VGSIRCREHRNQCSYCRSSDCNDNVLLCECCSYSGIGSLIQDFLTETQSMRICIYDMYAVSPDAAWACGCRQCIEATVIFHMNATA
jgi:hypothetical protein